MITTKQYVVRDVVGPAGQVIGGHRRSAGQVVRLTDEEADQAASMVTLAEGMPEPNDGPSELGPAIQPPATDATDATDADATDADADDATDYDAMTKDELLHMATERGVAADASMRKADIIEALKGAE